MVTTKKAITKIHKEIKITLDILNVNKLIKYNLIKILLKFFYDVVNN